MILQLRGKKVLYTSYTLDDQRYEPAVQIYTSQVKIPSSSYAKFKLAITYGLDGDYRLSIQLLE